MRVTQRATGYGGANRWSTNKRAIYFYVPNKERGTILCEQKGCYYFITYAKACNSDTEYYRKKGEETCLSHIPRDVKEQIGCGLSQDSNSGADEECKAALVSNSNEVDELGALRVACHLASEKYIEDIGYMSTYNTTHKITLSPGQDLTDEVSGMVIELEKRASDVLACLLTLESEFQKWGGCLSEIHTVEWPETPFLQGFYSFPSTKNGNFWAASR
jgi:hypothetical protein